MIVNELRKLKKKDLYKVVLDDISYEFSEDIVVKYRLVKGKEIDDKLIRTIIKDNNLDSLYNKALNYAIRYGKGSSEVKRYLINKEASNKDAELIVDRLIKNKIISDNDILDNLIFSYVKNGNGILLIKEKLYQKGFNKETIEDRLNFIDYDLYYKKMNDLYIKNFKANKKDNDFDKKLKAKNNLLRRGYTYSDIDKLYF